MGKDQELLEAARTGNLQAVKTILSGKLPHSGRGSGGLTGGLRSLLALKPVNVNCTDTSGETPLHLAALNGHREVVRALLAAKGSVTEVDSKGCTPLHLAAWNGHTEICDILLQHASDKSIVNLQTNEGETPLHFASQHGHHDVVSLLLQNKADPIYRTLTGRSALDLAAQYGKTAVVRTLVTGRHELLTHVAGQPSPLHLAAFNGHLPIVGFLLDSGFPVNTRTDNGTALHEAATSCKLDVIKLLLDKGVDVWAKAKNDMTAEDILKDIHSKLTHEALQIISGHVNSQRTPDSDGERDINGIPGPGNSVQGDATPPGSRRPVPKPRSMYGADTLEKTKAASSQSCQSEPQSPPPPLPPRISLRHIDAPEREPAPLPDAAPLLLTTELNQGPTRSRDASPMGSGSREQPKKPPRKTPSMRKTEATQTATATTTTVTSSATTGGSSDHLAASYDKPLPPPPCDTDLSRMDYVNVDLDKMSSVYPPDESSATSAPTETDGAGETVIIRPRKEEEGERKSFREEETRRVNSAGGNGESRGADSGSGGGGEVMAVSTKRESLYANVAMLAEEEMEAKINKPKSLELDGSKKRESTGTAAAAAAEGDQPVSPSNYAQPPTPDCPPPSPSTALQGIQQKINPQDKRKSKDMETITETTLMQAAAATAASQEQAPAVKEAATEVTAQEVTPAPPAPSGGSPHASEQRLSQGLEPVLEEKGGNSKASATAATTTETTVSTASTQSDDSTDALSNISTAGGVMTKSVGGAPITIDVEGEVVEMRRSVSSGDNPIDWDSNVFAGLLKGSTPGGLRNVVSQICENVVVKTVRSKRRSTPSTIVTFDPLMEKEEDRDVIDADRVLDEIDQMTIGPGKAGVGGPSATTAAATTATTTAGGGTSGGGGPGGPRGRNSVAVGRGKSDEIFDDSEEWAKGPAIYTVPWQDLAHFNIKTFSLKTQKIAATLETFGGGMARESVFVREYEASFTKSLAGRQNIQSVGEWLDSLGLGQYENTLVANGFDDTDFLGGTIIEDQDLSTIGITNDTHRAEIVAAAHRLPPVQPIDQKILPESVERWLESIHLSQYLDTFVSHSYNTMLRVIKLWELELTTVLDISSLGHRKRILASLGDRPHLERDSSLSPARVRRRGSEEDEPPKSPFDHIDLYRDYTGVKPQATDKNGDQGTPPPSPLMAFDKAAENGPGSPQGIRDSQIHIRPPHLMHTTGSIKQWRHRPEVLIKGCCNYTAHYLGSTIVKELKGATSTQEGIARLKQRLRRKLQKSTEVINKIPTIMLSISYKGVKFIDAKSKRVICDHEIANIFCACQDGDHLNFFAYVTKDKETSKHYCHVFSVRSRELAGEIILTLGEAFEIAYQMALKEKAEEDAVQFERQLSQSDQDDATSVSSKASVNTV